MAPVQTGVDVGGGEALQGAGVEFGGEHFGQQAQECATVCSRHGRRGGEGVFQLCVDMARCRAKIGGRVDIGRRLMHLVMAMFRRSTPEIQENVL